jgi:Glucodextranase, domain B
MTLEMCLFDAVQTNEAQELENDMKKLQRDSLLILGLIAAFGYASSASLWAQPQLSVAQLAALQPIDPSALPEDATFWLAKGRDPDSPSPPFPMIPAELSDFDLPICPLGGNAFLIDDSSVDYSALDEGSQINSALRTLEAQDGLVPDPGDGGDDGSGGDSNVSSNSPAFPYPPGSLWLALAMTNDLTYGNMAAITVNGTTNDTWYEILAKGTLADPKWWSEGSMQGFANQAVSQTSVTADGGAHTLFLLARTLTNGSGDTLPIWWQLQNFGRTGLDPNADPSGQGISLLESYLEGAEPNVIQFSVAATNNYANASPAALQLEISEGLPFYQTVLVDSTNFAGAIWSRWTSTNLSVDLGSTEGWHDVWIGLRGFSASSYQAWEWKRLKLDRTAPQLALLSPAQGVVTQPIIQLAGSCPEALGAIWYDLSNAAGLLPNQDVLMLDQYFDTNTQEFTTNMFQAFDVELAGGTNVITLHATDLAGNQTATNFTFVLDYSGKTNPPAIQLDWPQDGAQIGASTFTLHGLTDDPTARVQAQVTGANGRLHTYFGLVERTGKFWVDNIPLAAGTNTVALTITDAAGNSRSTSISVIESTLMLTMNPVTPASQLWQPTVNVSGTISDPSYAVWVNGVKAANPGDGTWTAGNVTVNQGGTAVFRMTAYSPDEQQPDGSYGNGN